MCRLLVVRAARPVEPASWIVPFAERCRESPEYQGHGWGVSWWTGARWEHRRWIEPIWESTRRLADLPASDLLLVHARSAFRDEGIEVANNMPFVGDGLAFAFNGELRGVRLNAPGATGAARLFHLLRRFHAAEGDLRRAVARLDRVVVTRTEYVRALNLVVSDGGELCIHGRHSEDPDYFTLWKGGTAAPDGPTVVASEPLEAPLAGLAWSRLSNPVTLSVPAPASVVHGRPPVGGPRC